MGLVYEARGDLVEAAAAYRRSDELGSANGAMNLGILLATQGDADAVIDALQRAESRGVPDAAHVDIRSAPQKPC